MVPVFDVALLGRRWGWKVERRENLPGVAAAIRAGGSVAVYQDAGRRDWLPPAGADAPRFTLLADWPTEARWSALIVVSDRSLPALPAGLDERTVVFRPPTLTLGVGCPPATALDELEAVVAELFDRFRLSAASLTALAAGILSREDEALVAFAEDRRIPFLTYAPDKLALVRPRPPAGQALPPLSPADVCEPAAMLAACVRELVVPKTMIRGVALAVARRPVA
jgi:cobalt-precorrin 5A hydrolase